MPGSMERDKKIVKLNPLDDAMLKFTRPLIKCLHCGFIVTLCGEKSKRHRAVISDCCDIPDKEISSHVRHGTAMYLYIFLSVYLCICVSVYPFIRCLVLIHEVLESKILAAFFAHQMDELFKSYEILYSVYEQLINKEKRQ